MDFQLINSNKTVLKLAQEISEKNFSGSNEKVIIFTSVKYEKVKILGGRETNALLLPKRTAEYECWLYPELEEVRNILSKSFDFIIWFGNSVSVKSEEEIKRHISHELRHVYQHKQHSMAVAKERLTDVALSIYGLPFNTMRATDKDAIDFENRVVGVPLKYNCDWIGEIENSFENHIQHIKWIKKEILENEKTKIFPIIINIGKKGEKGWIAEVQMEFFNYLYDICFPNS